MYKKAKYITTISEKDKKITYLLCKNPQTLVPLELKDESNFAYPDFKTLCNHILNALKTRVVCAKIYRYQDDVFYSYITFKRNGICVDVNAHPVVALKMCKIFGAPVLINEQIVKILGLKITRQMVQRALENESAHPASY
ncbi:MAG: hypothetical protein KatS3mg101_0146 [Patescibacteria group bacterium]|nr:MAG: hypothetical protein KatS3mg101_0146 [Patescibacteria group bacterium]